MHPMSSSRFITIFKWWLCGASLNWKFSDLNSCDLVTEAAVCAEPLQELSQPVHQLPICINSWEEITAAIALAVLRIKENVCLCIKYETQTARASSECHLS